MSPVAVAVLAALATAGPARAQQAPDRHRGPRRDHRHRAEARAEPAGGPDRGVGRDRQPAGLGGWRQHRGPEAARADPQHPQDQHVHQPGAVPARRRHDQLRDRGAAERRVRARRGGDVVRGRGLCGTLRREPRRGARRPAGHAVRQERLGRRAQRRLHQAGRRARGLCRPRLFPGRRDARQGRHRRADLGQAAHPDHRVLGRVRRLHQQRQRHEGGRRYERLRPLGRAHHLGCGPDRQREAHVHRRLPQVRRQLLRRDHRRGTNDCHEPGDRGCIAAVVVRA